MTTKNCAGTYKVSGYKREDGTKVDSYWRTCGAKHENSDNSTSSHPTSKSKDGVMTGAAAEINGYDENFIINSYLNGYIKEDFKSSNMDYSTSSSNLQEYITKNFNVNSSFMRYYQLSLDFNNKKSFNKDNSYTKVKDLSNSNLKWYIKDKYLVDDKTDVVIVHHGSQLFNEVVSSTEFINFLKDNYLKIQNGELINKPIQLNFHQTLNLHLTIGKSIIYSPKFDNKGNFSATLIDYYDFDKIEIPAKSSIKDKFIAYVNNNAYLQQKSGKLTNFVTIIPIVLFRTGMY